MGFIGKQTRSSKALGDQIGVDIVVDQVSRGGDLRPGVALEQVTARVGGRGVKLQTL